MVALEGQARPERHADCPCSHGLFPDLVWEAWNLELPFETQEGGRDYPSTDTSQGGVGKEHPWALLELSVPIM
jgi:hypothetical protein